MADPRTVTTVASVVLAVACASWAIYEAKHDRPVDTFAAAAGPRAPVAVQVITAEAQLRPLRVGLQAIGTAVANESVEISSKTTNIVTAIRFTDGQWVEAGQVLVELDRESAAADLAAATAEYEESLSQWNRARELVSTQVLSRSQFEQIEATMKSNLARMDAARARLADTYIRAPFAGRVGLRRVSLGALVTPGTVITTLDDTNTIKVDFAVPEMQLGSLARGQKVVARTSAYPGRDFSGTVASIDSRVDAATRSVVVRATVPNRDGALKPGMFMTVELTQDERPALVIPEEALVPEQARQFVFVAKNGVADKREVTLGRREPGFVEITDGLAAGEAVVIEGTLKLRHGTPVIEAGQEPPPPPADGFSDPSGGRAT
jgi:membrane fusion protein (multidrug efflux system)|nr:MAG: efflux transporter periplasmic adaptor subunit [Pseudomonadota bacterium]